MHTGSLPAPPSVGHLKNPARDLLTSCRAGHPAALVRFRKARLRPSAVPDDHSIRLSLSLRDPQRVIAAEHGFANWSDLRTNVERKESIQLLEGTIDKIRVNPASHLRVIVLKGKSDDRCLPIWTGSAEADFIALKLEGRRFLYPGKS